MTWREYCDECGYSIGGLNSKAMAEHLMRIHNNSGACPVEGAQIEQEQETDTNTNTNNAN